MEIGLEKAVTVDWGEGGYSSRTQLDKGRPCSYQTGRGPCTGSATAACALSVALLRKHIKSHGRDEQEPGLLAGLVGWLASTYVHDANPSWDPSSSEMATRFPMYHHDYLWLVSRVFAGASITHVNGEDWYRVGATYLVETQKPNGSWKSSDVIPPSQFPAAEGEKAQLRDTCFALLFLSAAKAGDRWPDILVREAPATAATSGR
jgi:hypothetical protein